MKAPKVDGQEGSWGTAPEREEKSLRTILNSRMENSSAHGVPNIQRSSGPVTKLAWSLVFLTGISVMTWQAVILFQTYFEWNYSVNLEVRFNRTQSFPAITICNANPIKRSELETRDALFQALFDVHYVPSMPDLPDQQPLPDEQPLPDVPGKAVIDWRSRIAIPRFYRMKSVDYGKKRIRVVTLANATLEERVSLGHKLDDMLLDCSWKGIPCSPENFTKFYDSKLGNCYTFNSGQNEEQLTTHRPGSTHGLTLELFVQQDEYVEGMTEVAGFRVSVHHPSIMPFPEYNGLLVSPGFATDIGLRVLEVDRLPKPYGDCKADLKQGIEDDIYHQHYNITYNRKTCEVSCFQNEVISRCDCFDATYPNSLKVNRTVYPCEYINDVETQCMADIEMEHARDELECNCPLACRETTYLTSVSSSIWPSDAYESTLIEKMVKYNAEIRRHVVGENASDWTRRNMAKVEIFYDEFNYEHIRQDAAYTIPDLLSDIGGQLGLWLGLSIITIFEFFEGAWLLLAFFCSQSGNKTKRSEIDPGTKTT
ncbi:amiloride-sensitive sodium channel subunit beta isoform X2 [Strongylocentrotus purpuratus]|uniref:Uncharacterized protein n=1 Tax=Strongylocentrotus purpuratus TaxID=7668 RepID=A0A7M7N865_STRPU|nr:amiloride-sensitive sodium channel subunit beta isoform X2 [Strongylocentrotus purpuratus]